MTFARRPYTRPEPYVPKAQTRRQDDKGPTRSADWLARIRARPCLVCTPGRQMSPTRPHHTKGLFPPTMGKKISDLLCLPLCDWHHTTGPAALHRTGDEAAWWQAAAIEPYGVILALLAQCRDSARDEAIAFVKLHRERAT